jgi:peptide/nickel transport system ATP-binding protein
VLTQANILNVLKRIKQELGTSFILITHDIATSSELADRCGGDVCRADRGDERCAASFTEPLHPYSKKLMASVPGCAAIRSRIYHRVSRPACSTRPPAAGFADRCPMRFDRCDEEPPMFRQDGRLVKCWLYD